MVNRILVFSLSLLFFSTAALAQVTGDDAVVRPVRVDKPPKIDGLLNEQIWKQIEPISDFRQRDPEEGEPASELTEVRVCYDSHYLYIGVRAFDSEPDKIIARQFERDGAVDNDDTFTIAIDSLDDNRTAVAFDCNVHGTQLDVEYTEGGNYNGSWDAIWYSKGNIDSQGYTLEFAIPFFVLRFKPADEVRMGVLFERLIRRKNEQVMWPFISRDYDFVSVSQYGRMEGLKGIERGVNLEFKPYGIAGYNASPGEDDYDADAGLDVKWGATSNFTVDMTLNTDFAQVESDALLINLSRFSLYYPEKRDFFLESADLFKFGLSQSAEIFFSRRIGIRGSREVPIIGGARAYGLLGDTNVGVMTMQTDDIAGYDGENFTVGRVKHNVLGRSYIGAIVTSRRGIDSQEDTTVGGDFRYLVGRNFKVEGLMARSDRDGVDEGNWMGNLLVSHSLDIYDFTLRYTDIGENFDPGMGYVQRPDQRALLLNVHYKPRPDIPGVRQLTFGNVYQRIENHAGVLETRRIRPGFLAVFDSGDSLMLLYDDRYEYTPYAFPIGSGVIIPAGEYTNRQVIFEAGTTTSRKLSGGTGLNTGPYYDGDVLSAYAWWVYRPMPRLYLGSDYYYDKVDVPGGEFTSHIGLVQASYYFSPTLTTRLAMQYSSLFEDFVFNFRMRWIYAPGSEAWLVYDESRRFSIDGDSLLDRALILKIVHNFNF